MRTSTCDTQTCMRACLLELLAHLSCSSPQPQPAQRSQPPHSPLCSDQQPVADSALLPVIVQQKVMLVGLQLAPDLAFDFERQSKLH